MRRWENQEEQFLLDNAQNIGINEIAKTLGRTPKSVRRKLESLGFLLERRNLWTEGELDFIAKNQDNMTLRELSQNLPRHTYDSLVAKFYAR